MDYKASDWAAELFQGDMREAREVLGRRFVEYAGKTSWDEASSMIDRLEAGILFPQDTEPQRDVIRRFFAVFRAEWVTRQ